MELAKRKIKDITPYKNNPRNNTEAVAGVAESIKQCGYVSPIIIDEDGIILAGHTRRLALLELYGEDYEAPVVVKDGLTEEQKRKYRILDNKVAETATWDFEKLAQEIEGLDFGGFDFGFDIPEEIMEPNTQEDDYEPEVPEEPKSKMGQLYKLGNHRLLCGDSTKMADVRKLVGGGTVDMLLTDPPYGVDYHGTAGSIANDNLKGDEFTRFLQDAFSNADAVMRDGAAFYIWHADSKGHTFREAVSNVGWKVRQCLIWVKNSLVLGRQDYQWKHEPCLYGWKNGSHYFCEDRTQTTVIEDKPNIKAMKKDELVEMIEQILGDDNVPTTVIHENKPARNAEHPTMKPIKLLARQVKNSTKMGQGVLDLFGGSGSTLVTCEQLGRKCYMMEFDPRFVDVIIDRWEKLTGQKAELLN